jgi:hypothetical protein
MARSGKRSRRGVGTIIGSAAHGGSDGACSYQMYIGGVQDHALSRTISSKPKSTVDCTLALAIRARMSPPALLPIS